MFRKALICAATSLVLGSSAQAGLVDTTASSAFWFTDSWTTFKTATGATRTTNDLSGLLDGVDPVEPNTSVVGFSVPGIGTLSGQGTFQNGANTTNGRHAVDENGVKTEGRYIEGSSSPATLVIEFGAAVHAFSFWGTDIGDFSSSCTAGSSCDGAEDGDKSAAVLSVELFRGGVSQGLFRLSGTATNDSEDFYGFLSKDISFDKAAIGNLTTNDGQGISTMSVSTEATDAPGGNNDVPEPGMLALLAAGLFGLTRFRRA